MQNQTNGLITILVSMKQVVVDSQKKPQSVQLSSRSCDTREICTIRRHLHSFYEFLLIQSSGKVSFVPEDKDRDGSKLGLVQEIVQLIP